MDLTDNPLNPDYWKNDFGEQLGVDTQTGGESPPAAAGSIGSGDSDGEVTLTPAESAGLSDVEAAKLIGWLEVLGSMTDPTVALEADVSITGWSAVELQKATAAMQMYCTDHDENWRPGPGGSPGICY